MTRFRFQYPGDPVDSCVLMSGAEFVQHVRGGRDTAITVSYGDDVVASVPIAAEDVVCDTCNASIHWFDPCYLARGRTLYCYECAGRWILPHAIPGSAETTTPSHTERA